MRDQPEDVLNIFLNFVLEIQHKILVWVKGAFHLSELPGQTPPEVMRISLLIKTILLHQSNPK